MNSARLIFEVRYTFILNFNQVYRGLLTPFVKLCNNNIGISNENRVQEQISFNFTEEGFRIDVNFEKISLIVDGDIDKVFTDDNASVKTFFDILNKLKEQDYFGEVVIYNFYNEVLSLSEKEKPDLLNSFKNKFLASNFPDILKGNDFYQLNYSTEHSGITEVVNIQTFDGKFIMQNKGSFYQVNKFEIVKYYNKNGLHIGVQFSEKINKVDYKLLRNLVKKSIDKIEQIVNYDI